MEREGEGENHIRVKKEQEENMTDSNGLWKMRGGENEWVWGDNGKLSRG